MWNGRVSLFLLEFSCKMQDLMHDDEEVITTPLGVAHNKLGHDRIDLLNNVHSKQLL